MEEEKPDSKYLEVYTAEEFCKKKFDYSAWLIPKLIPGTGVILLQAHPKVGKSIFSIQLAHALGTATPFLGREVTKRRKVLYVQCDEPELEWQEQIKMIKLTEGWSTTWIPPGAIDNPAQMNRLRNTVKKDEYNFIIYDSFIKIVGQADLDNPRVAEHVIRMLGHGPKIPILINHHKRKGMAGIVDRTASAGAGSFNIAGTASVVIDLMPKKIEIIGRLVGEEIDVWKTTEGGSLPPGMWFPKVVKGKDDPSVYD